MKFLLAILCVVLSLACSNPKNTRIPKDLANMESIKPAVEKLKQEEKELLTGYLMRHTLGSAMGAAFGAKSDPIPDGMTIGKAIDEQSQFVAKVKANEATEKAAKEKLEAARKALAEQMAQVLSVKPSEISLHLATFRDYDVNSYIKLVFVFENKGQKTITGIKGIATFRDKFGDVVSSLPMKVEEELKSGTATTVKLSKRYNQFDHDDQKLAGLDANTVKFELAPEVVLFSDGTKFEAPAQEKK